MSKPIFLNSFSNDKPTYTYEELKTKWTNIQKDKTNQDYGFFAAIFSFDDDVKQKCYSKSIFDKIAGLDEKEGLSKEDILKLANKSNNDETGTVKALTRQDFFENIYEEVLVKPNKKNEPELSRAEQMYNSLNTLNTLYVFDKNNKFLTSDDCEKKLQGDLKKVSKDIINYAKEYKDDKEIQKYAEALIKLGQNGKISTSYSNELTAEVLPDDNMCDNINNSEIKFYIPSEENFNYKLLMRTMFHELHHYIKEDGICGKKTEEKAENVGIEEAEKVLGTKIFKNKEQHINDFIKLYKNKYLYTAGYGPSEKLKLPINSGLYTNQEIHSVDWNKNKDICVVKLKPEDENYSVSQKIIIKYGNKKDLNGNPLPLSRIDVYLLADGTLKVNEQNVKNKDYETNFLTKNNKGELCNGDYKVKYKYWKSSVLPKVISKDTPEYNDFLKNHPEYTLD